MLHDVLLASEIARRVRPSGKTAWARTLTANRMTPLPCYPLSLPRHSRSAAAHCETSAARRLTPLPTYGPPGQFSSGGETQANFRTGPHVANAPARNHVAHARETGVIQTGENEPCQDISPVTAQLAVARMPSARHRPTPGTLGVYGQLGCCGACGPFLSLSLFSW